MKRRIRLKESDLKNIIKRSAYRLLREYMFDNPLNQTDLDGSEFDDNEGMTPSVDDMDYDPDLYGQEIYDDDYLDDSQPYSDYIPSASDFDDFDNLNLESRKRFKKSVNEVSGRMHCNIGKEFTPRAKSDVKEKDKKGWGKKKDKEWGDWYENKSYLRKVVKESINRVLNEGLKGVDPNNVVPEDLARQYGFKTEYADSANGLELWGRDIPNYNPNRLLFKLGIRNFTSISNTAFGMHVRITVKPSQRINDRMRTPRKIGDYVNSEYGDSKGIIFNNPKNGHTRRLDKFGNFN